MADHAEIYLFAQVAQARKQQIKKILAGYCSMTPVDVVERRVIFQPPRPPPPNLHIGASQSIAVVKANDAGASAAKDVFYAQLRKDVAYGQMGKEDQMDAADAADGWSMIILESPDPQFKTTGLRKVSEIPLDGSYSTPFEYMQAMGYTYAGWDCVVDSC
jgi:Med18 protein